MCSALASSHQPFFDPQADGNDNQDGEGNRQNIQLRMYDFARVQRPDYVMEEPDNIVDWSQPGETYNPDTPASAAFMRYGLRLSNLEPVEAKHWQERSRYVIGTIYESNGYLSLQGR